MTDSKPQPGRPLSSEGAARQDKKDLRRGVLVNLFGYILKLAHPLALVLVVRGYGAELFGVFTFVQATTQLAARVGGLGLDKACLWFVPRQQSEERYRFLGSVLRWVALSSITTMAVLLAVLWSPWVAGFGIPANAVIALGWMALTIPLQALMDVLIHSLMGSRSMGPQVLIRETLLPLSTVGFAMFAMLVSEQPGMASVKTHGLPFAHVAAHVVATVVACVVFYRAAGGFSILGSASRLEQAELRRFAVPMWLAEMSNSFLMRLDTYTLTWLGGDLKLVGIYGVVLNFSNSVRAIRRSFDPIVLAITAQIGRERDGVRLRAAFSSATRMITLTQVPVFVFLLVFARDLMPLYGDGFQLGAPAVVILCGFWLVISPANLAGVVVSAYGYSRLSLYSVFVAIAAQAAFAWVLVPPLGIVGTALSVGLGYCAQAAVQLWQMQRVTGSWNFEPRTLAPLLWGACASLPGAALVAGFGWAATLEEGMHGLALRASAFALFGATYVSFVIISRRAGPPPEPREKAELA